MKKLLHIKGGRGVSTNAWSADHWLKAFVDEHGEPVEIITFVRVTGHWCCKLGTASRCVHDGFVLPRAEDSTVSINVATIDVVEPIPRGTLLWLAGREVAFFAANPPEPAPEIENAPRGRA